MSLIENRSWVERTRRELEGAQKAEFLGKGDLNAYLNCLEEGPFDIVVIDPDGTNSVIFSKVQSGSGAKKIVCVDTNGEVWKVGFVL